MVCCAARSRASKHIARGDSTRAQVGRVQIVNRLRVPVRRQEYEQIGIETPIDFIEQGVPFRLITDLNGNMFMRLNEVMMHLIQEDIELFEDHDEWLFKGGHDRVIKQTEFVTGVRWIECITERTPQLFGQ